MYYPILSLLLGFIFGILSIRFSIPNTVEWMSFLFFLILTILQFLKPLRLFTYLAMFILFFGLGHFSVRSELNRIDRNSSLIHHLSAEKVYWVAEVEEDCVPQEQGWHLKVQVQSIQNEKGAFEARGGLLLKIAEGACDFHPGDLLQGFSKIKVPSRLKNFHSFDLPFYYRIQGILATSFIETTSSLVKLREGASSVFNGFPSIQKNFSKSIEFLPEDSQAFLKALLLGEQSSLSEEIQSLFRKTGTTHLLVVSGFHLVMLGGFLYFFIRIFSLFCPGLLLKISIHKTAVILSMIGMLFYAALVGFSPSVLRALLSAYCAGFFFLFSEERDPLGILFFIALILLIFHPFFLFQISFQLSFLSVFSILFFTPSWLAILEGLKKNLSGRILYFFLSLLLMSLAAQLGLAPLLIYHFHQISWVAPLTNLILVPLFSFFFMPLGMLALGLSGFHLFHSELLFQLLGFGFERTLALLKFFSKLPYSHSYLISLSAVQIIFYYLLLYTPRLHFSFKRKIALIALCLFLIFVTPLIQAKWNQRDSSLTFHFLDVGQGDALWIEFPNHQNMIVDGGGSIDSKFDFGERILLPELLSRGVSQMDWIVLSHPHPDHYKGLQALFRAYRPQEFWWNGENISHPDFQSFLNQVQASGAKEKVFREVETNLEIAGVQIQIFSPFFTTPFKENPNGHEINNRSLVLKIKDRGLSVLLAGDIEKETEMEMLKNKTDLKSDILKVPHHGSDTSSTDKWVRSVCPQMAWMSLGKENPFRFPRPSVVQNYEKIKTQIFRSDQVGNLDLKWDGKSLKMRSFIEPQWELLKDFPNPLRANPEEICGGRSLKF